MIFNVVTNEATGAATSITLFGSSLKGVSLGAKLASFSLKALASVLNMFAVTVVLTSLSHVVALIQDAINAEEKQAEKLEEATKAAKEYADAIKSIREESKKTADSANEIAKEYAKLAQGVDTSTNKNTDLPLYEYERFLELNNRLAELFPSLTKDYDENGNAILNLSGDVDTVTASIAALVKQQKKLAKIDLKENLEKYVDGDGDSEGALTVIKGQKNKVDELQNTLDGYTHIYNALVNDTGIIDVEDYKGLFNDFSDMLGEDFDIHPNYEYWSWDDWSFHFAIDTNELEFDESELNAISSAYQTIYEDLYAQIETAKSELKNRNAELSQQMMLWVEDLAIYKDNGKHFQDAISSMISNIDWASLGIKDYVGVQSYIQNNILTPLQTVCNDPDKKAQVMSALSGLFSLNLEKLSPTKAKELVDAYIKQLALILEKDPIELKINFGFGDVDVAAQEYEKTLNRFGEDSNVIAKYFSDMGINTSEEIDSFNQLTAGINNAKDAIIAYEKAKNIGGEFDDIFTLEDTEGTLTSLGRISKEIDDLQSAFSGLKKAMDSYNETGKFTVDQVQDILSYGDKYLPYLINEEGQLDLNEEALLRVADARLQELKAKLLSNLASNIEQIKDEEDALKFLAGTLDETADGYKNVAENALNTFLQMVALGNTDITEETAKNVEKVIKNSISAINQMIDSIDRDSLWDSTSNSAKKATELLEAELKELDARMDAGYIEFKDYIRQRKELIEDYYRQGKIQAAEYYDYLSKHYEKELSYMDRIQNYVVKRIDKEIESLNDRKDEIEEYYNLEIEKLEDQKKLLEEQNAERDRQLALEKALYNLQRAQEQRSVKTYTGSKGYQYTSDGDAIRDASDEVTQAKLDLELSKIEDAIEKLEEASEREQKVIDEQIDKLEEYKEKWQEITDKYIDEQDRLLTEQFFGQNWEAEILSGRMENLTKFSEDYISIQKSIVDYAWWASNEQVKAQQALENGDLGGAGAPPEVSYTANTDYQMSDASISKKLKNDEEKYFGVNNPPEPSPSYTQESPVTTPTPAPTAEPTAEPTATPTTEGTIEPPNGVYSFVRDGYVYVWNGKDRWVRDVPVPQSHHTGLKKGLVGDKYSSADFEVLKKYGLKVGEVPAILKKGEAVLTQAQMANIAYPLRMLDAITSGFDAPNVSNLHKNQNSVVQHINVTLPNITNEGGYENLTRFLKTAYLDSVQYKHK